MPRMPAGHRDPSNPTRIAANDRHAQALELRREGLGFGEIAKRVGYNDRGAAYKAIMAELEKRVKEPAEAVLQLELDRLDALLAAAWPKAMKGNEKSIHAALRVLDRRAKYLGLDDYDARMATVAERRVALEEAQALIVVSVLRQVLDRLDLSPEQAEAADTAIPSVLRIVAGDAEDPEVAS